MEIQAEYGITDTGGLVILRSACESFDRCQAAKALLDKDGPVFVDRYGQPRVHPAAAVERDNRAAMLSAIKALNLDVVTPRDGPGRPGRVTG